MIQSCQILGFTFILVLLVLVFSLQKSLREKKINRLPDKLARKHYLIFWAAILLVGVVPRLVNLTMFYQNDEGYYMYVAKKYFEGGSLYNQLLFGHPPLYPIVTAQIFKVFGVGLVQAKLVPVTLSILTLPLLFMTVKRFWGVKEAMLSTLIWSFNPLIMINAGNPGMYAELIFFSLASAILLLVGLDEGGKIKIFFSGVLAGLAASYRMFGLYLIFVGIIYLCLRDRKQVLPYFMGLLLVVAPLFIHYFNSSPETFSYMLFGYHESKNILGLSFLEKLGSFVKNFTVYPMFFIFPILAILNRKKGLDCREDVTTFFAMWFSGIILLPFIPMHKAFLINNYSIFFLPPLAILSGRFVEFLNDRYCRLFVACIILINISMICFTFLLNIENYSTIGNVKKYVEHNTRQQDTITGDLTPMIYFIGGRDLTSQRFNMTPNTLMKLSEGADGGKCETECEIISEKIISTSAYVLVSEREGDAEEMKTQLERRDCIAEKNIGDVILYTCG
ncbi:MAG: glycosyltransferase family 39 protein [Methanobacteriota archaeon]